MTFGGEMRRIRDERRMSLRALAGRTAYSFGYLGQIERGERTPPEHLASALDSLFGTGDLFQGLVIQDENRESSRIPDDDVGDLCALAAHAERSDVTTSTLDTVDASVDAYARAYSRTPPHVLLSDVRALSRQVGALMDGRATLAQRRRLTVAGGWLALLAATLHIDLGRRRSAVVARSVAASLGHEAGHDEIGAWAVEIDTWAALVDQDWRRAAVLADAGAGLAPSGSGAAVQLTAQRARAAARLEDGVGVRDALGRAEQLVGRQSAERPADHHFAFDARKLDGYTATALSWVSDPAGERQARAVVDAYQPAGPRRRLATARLDLGLILARDRRPDEAAQLGALAVDSGTLVPSNIWRATELADALHGFRDVSEVAELRERFVDHP